MPILVCGTKVDLCNQKRKHQSFASEIGADEIQLNCRTTQSIHAGSSEAVKLGRFFDRVIERKYYSRDSSGLYDKNRKYASGLLKSPIDTNRFVSPFASPLANYSNFSSQLTTISPTTDSILKEQ